MTDEITPASGEDVERLKAHAQSLIANLNTTEALILFQEEAARYFDKMAAESKEDRAHWAAVYNAENFRHSAARLRALEAEIKRLRNAALEEAAEVADAEPELPGDCPGAWAGRRTMSYAESGPAEVHSLASYLCEEMLAREWTSLDVARAMGGGTRSVERNTLIVDLLLVVQRDKLVVADETFRGLARAFGVSDDLFRNLDREWRRWPDRRVPFECPESILSR